MTDDNKSRLEINLRKGITMDIVTDTWIRRCIGIAIVVGSLAMFALAIAPLVKIILGR